MMKPNLPKSQVIRTILLAAIAVVLALAFVAPAPQVARADRITPPPVPGNLVVPPGNQVFFTGHAIGTQNYICLPSGAGFSWTFLGPQATLFDDEDEQVITHFLSPNPDEGGTARATWLHSRDSSSVWAAAIQSSTDPAFVAPGAIPWLLLRVLGSQDGPTGGSKLSPTTYIQRVNTVGGVAPSTGCAALTDVGQRRLVAYEADYFFFK